MQDEKALADARNAIKENAAKMDSEAKKVDGFERDLRKEEKALEEICESLKGMFMQICR